MNRFTANAADLAADYKARGINRQATYSMFVMDRALKPEISAKEFFAIFDIVSPSMIKELGDFPFHPTHWDKELKEYVEIFQDKETGVYTLIWAHGHKGTNPPSFPMDNFISLADPEFIPEPCP
jgi:hypothetical protein